MKARSKLIVAASMMLAAAALGVLVMLGRPYTPVAGAAPEAQKESYYVFDTTCTNSDIKRNRYGWIEITRFNITLRVDRIVKGDFRDSEVVLAWQETDWVDPDVHDEVEKSWFQEGERFRLFARHRSFGRLWGLKISRLDEARKWVSRAVQFQVQRLQDEDSDIRLAAARTLAAYGADAHVAVPELQKLCTDPVKEVRSAACEALKAVRPSATEP